MKGSKMPKMTPGNSYFAGAPAPHLKRSRFDRSASNKFDFDAGKLIPFYVDELLPSDTFEGKLHANIRIQSALDKPLMDNIYADVHWIVVPLRQIWNNFEKFMGARIPTPESSIDYLTPKLSTANSSSTFPAYSNFDYMGLPTEVANINNLKITSLFSRAINHAYNELYRDQNLQNMLPVPLDDGPDDIELNLYNTLLDFNKRKDYFTSAFTEPQKGPAATLPIGSDVDLTGITGLTVARINNAPNRTFFKKVGTNNAAVSQDIYTQSEGAIVNQPNNEEYSYDPNGTLFVNGSAATATAQIDVGTINALRAAEALQSFLERDNRGGTRYPELIYSHFKQISPDARQQRPELVGSGTLLIQVNPIAQTAPSPEDPSLNNSQGNLAGMGIASTHNNSPIGFTYSSTEHQIIIGFLRVRADLNYQQGLPRMWTRNTRYDFYWPEFAHLGEQPILRKELITTGVPADDNDVFGYQERFAEYKYRQGIISGGLRSNYATSLDNWHLAQEFAPETNLNGTFIEESPPIGRTVAVPSEKIFIADTFLELYCTRPMPVNAIPGMATHL